MRIGVILATAASDDLSQIPPADVQGSGRSSGQAIPGARAASTLLNPPATGCRECPRSCRSSREGNFGTRQVSPSTRYLDQVTGSRGAGEWQRDRRAGGGHTGRLSSVREEGPSPFRRPASDPCLPRAPSKPSPGHKERASGAGNVVMSHESCHMTHVDDPEVERTSDCYWYPPPRGSNRSSGWWHTGEGPNPPRVPD